MPLKSMFKHLYSEEPKPEFHFLDLPAPYTSGESSYMAASTKQFAVPKNTGGGPVSVYNMDKPGRGLGSQSTISTHKGKVLDLAFNPFVESLLGTASEDCTVCITKVPADMSECKENITTADISLDAHEKKCHLLKWHPSANNVLATTSWDKAVKLWNVSTSDCVKTYTHLESVPYSMEWNEDGSLLGLTTKGKKLVIVDPRMDSEEENQAAHNIAGFEGGKSSKVFWVPKMGWIGATGFNKQARRMLKIWDLKKMDTPIYSEVVDQMSSVLMPYMDNEHNVLYLVGKGDSTISMWQLTKKGAIVNNLSAFRGKDPQKGGAWVPKRGCDTSNIEIQRFYKLTKDSVIPLSFRLDRKNKKFGANKELFPDCQAGLPAMDAEEYFGGENKAPVTMEMDPAKRTDREEAKFEKKKTYAELAAENEALKTRIAELEKQVGSTE